MKNLIYSNSNNSIFLIIKNYKIVENNYNGQDGWPCQIEFDMYSFISGKYFYNGSISKNYPFLENKIRIGEEFEFIEDAEKRKSILNSLGLLKHVKEKELYFLLPNRYMYILNVKEEIERADWEIVDDKVIFIKNSILPSSSAYNMFQETRFELISPLKYKKNEHEIVSHNYFVPILKEMSRDIRIEFSIQMNLLSGIKRRILLRSTPPFAWPSSRKYNKIELYFHIERRNKYKYNKFKNMLLRMSNYYLSEKGVNQNE